MWICIQMVRQLVHMLSKPIPNIHRCHERNAKWMMIRLFYLFESLLLCKANTIL